MAKTKELQAIICCKKCNLDFFELWRKPTSNEGVFVHEMIPLHEGGKWFPDFAVNTPKQCPMCAGIIERKVA